MKFNYDNDNSKLICRLNEITTSSRVSHAYIFEGDSWLDKLKFAKTFAKGILCHKGLGENCSECSICDKIDHDNCEDLIVVGPSDSGSVKDESIENVQEKIKVKPFGSRYVVIIESADKMTERAQNRLLKTLEEPPGDSVIILLSENMENLVQTIRSRCVKFHMNHLGGESYDYMMETARELVDMGVRRSSFYAMTAKIKDIYKDKTKVRALLDSMEVVYRDMLVNGAGKITSIKIDDIVNNIHLVERASQDLSIGVSSTTTIKNLIIKIGG